MINDNLTTGAGGAGCGAGSADNAGQLCGCPQSQGPGVLCPAGPDPPAPTAGCLPSQAVAAGDFTMLDVEANE